MKGAVSQVVADVAEAAVKPVVEQVGKAIEEGVQSVVSGPKVKPQDPSVLQKKQDEEARRRQWAMRVIDWNRQIEASQAKVRQEVEQKLGQKQQEEQKQQVRQFQLQEKKKQDPLAVKLAKTKTEVRGGVGG